MRICLYTEANHQAEFYHQCKVHGIECALEVNTPAGRHDLVVLNAARNAFVAIVECKKTGSHTDPNSWQLTRYRMIGVPVYLLKSGADALPLLQRIIRETSGKEPVSIAAIGQMEHIRKIRSERRIARRLARERSGSITTPSEPGQKFWISY